MFGVALVPITIVYLVLSRHYRRTSREVQRLESVSRSPLYAYIRFVPEVWGTKPTIQGRTGASAVSRCFQPPNSTSLLMPSPTPPPALPRSCAWM